MNNIFSLLSDWRCLPTYAMERRADIYFALYMKEILWTYYYPDEKCCPFEYCTVIPEFPIKNFPKMEYNPKKQKNQEKKTNAAYYIDYVVFCKQNGNPEVHLIELKTDSKSYDKEQLYRMKRNACVRDLISGVLQIAEKTTEKAKYAYLLSKIAGILNETPEYLGATAKVCYIGPNGLKDKISDDEVSVIEFDKIQCALKRCLKNGDIKANAFYDALTEWNTPVNEVIKEKMEYKYPGRELKRWIGVVEENIKT